MRSLFAIIVLVCIASAAHGGDVFDTWMEGLERLRVSGRGDPAFDGNFLCPACAAMHGRAGDAVWPFAWHYLATGRRESLDVAEGVVAWAEANVLRADGSCVNDIGDAWRGTTAFFQCAIARALMADKGRLPDATRSRWLALFRRMSVWLRDGWMDAETPASPNVNYRAAYALSMEYARALLGDPDGAWRNSGDRQAALVIGAIMPDGLIHGEARPLGYVSPRGFRAVDFAYNLEETLPSMCAWAELRGDDDARRKIVRSALAHLEFILPDGAIDNSAGSRNCKWTYWGSRTSDGVIELLAFLSREGYPESAEIASRVVALYETCTDSSRGLLAGGLHAAESGEPICVHHTFCHLKMMPAWRESGFASAHPESVPRRSGVLRFPTDGVTIVRAGAWRATCWASDLIPGKVTANAFGSAAVSLLHHAEYGPVFVQSALDWRSVEPRNMQDPRTAPNAVLTPCVVSKDGIMSTGFDDEAEGTVSETDGCVSFETRARLCGRGMSRVAGEVTMKWIFSRGRVRIEAKSADSATLSIPVVAGADRGLSVNGNSASVKWKGGMLRIDATSPLLLGRGSYPGGRVYTTQSGFLAFPLSVDLPPGRAVSVEVSVAAKTCDL